MNLVTLWEDGVVLALVIEAEGFREGLGDEEKQEKEYFFTKSWIWNYYD